MAKEQSSTAVATLDHDAYSIIQADAGDVIQSIRDNMGGQQIKPSDLDRVKVPTGGSTTWTIPSIEGEKDAKTIDGAIIHKKLVRGYWPDSFDGQKNPPQCSSEDSITGIGNPGGACATCPCAQFGSKVDGKGLASAGQACKQMMLLFVIRPEDMLPIVISASPASLQNMKKYFLRLSSRGLAYYSVATSFALEKDKNAGGIVFSKIVPTMAGVWPKEVAAKFRDIGNKLRPILDSVQADKDTDF